MEEQLISDFIKESRAFCSFPFLLLCRLKTLHECALFWNCMSSRRMVNTRVEEENYYYFEHVNCVAEEFLSPAVGHWVAVSSQGSPKDSTLSVW